VAETQAARTKRERVAQLLKGLPHAAVHVFTREASSLPQHHLLQQREQPCQPQRRLLLLLLALAAVTAAAAAAVAAQAGGACRRLHARHVRAQQRQEQLRRKT
jgi:hypothetical protein